MPCQYIVVQVGDLWRGEFLNIGVFAYNMDPLSKEVYPKFVNSLKRVETTFGWNDGILKGILEGLRSINNKAKLEELMQGGNSPYSSLQFTEPRASLDEDPKKLAEEMAENFLVE